MTLNKAERVVAMQYRTLEAIQHDGEAALQTAYLVEKRLIEQGDHPRPAPDFEQWRIELNNEAKFFPEFWVRHSNRTYRVLYSTPSGRHHINYVASPHLGKEQGQQEAYEWAWRHEDMQEVYVDHQGGQRP